MKLREKTADLEEEIRKSKQKDERLLELENQLSSAKENIKHLGDERTDLIAKVFLALTFLAHLSRRLTGELIVYPCSGVRPSSVRRSQFQRSSPLKPLGQSKPNFMWSILRKGE